MAVQKSRTASIITDCDNIIQTAADPMNMNSLFVLQLRTPVRYEAGRESQIAVDTKDAGWGKLNLLLELNGRRLPVTCDERGDGLYVFSFHPPHNGSLSLQLSFNDNQIKGSPFYIQVGFTVLQK